MRQFLHVSPLALLLLFAGCASSNQGCDVPAADLVVPQVVQAPQLQIDPQLLALQPLPSLPNPDTIKSDDDYAPAIAQLFGDDLALRLHIQTIANELAAQKAN